MFPLLAFLAIASSHLEIQTNVVRVDYRVLMTGQAVPIERVAFAERESAALVKNLHLTVDGAPLSWVIESHRFDAGDGVSNFVFEVQALATLTNGPPETPAAGAFRDENFGDRAGPRQVAVEAGQGIKILTSSVPASLDAASPTGDVREAMFTFQHWTSD